MGSGDVEIELPNPWTLNINPSITLDGQDPIKTESTMTLAVPDPITTDSSFTLNVPQTIAMRQELAVTEPIVTDMSADMSIDVAPVVLDLSLTLGIKDLPRVCISRPYDRRFRMTVFGVEVFGIEQRGDRRLVVDDLPKKPFVAFGGEHHRVRERHEPKTVGDSGGGLRVTVG